VPRIGRWLFATALLLCALCVPGPASAAAPCDLVASPAGSDAASGSPAAPFRTVQKLADSLPAGRTGCLRGGTYAATSAGLALRVGRGGAPRAPIVLRSWPGERAVIAGATYVPASNVVLAGLTFDASKASNPNKAHVIDIKGSAVTVEDSEVTAHSWGTCFMLGNSSTRVTGAVLQRNVVHDCGDPGNTNQEHSIYGANSDGARIVENVFWGVSGYHIQLYPNSQHALVAHNVLDGGAYRGGIVFGGDSSVASSNNRLEANVITNAPGYGITTYWGGPVGSGNVAASNCLAGNRAGSISATSGFASSGNVTADPGYLNGGAHDYRLRPGSPCLGVVGYDTAARLAGGTPPAQSAPGRCTVVVLGHARHGRRVKIQARRGRGRWHTVKRVRARHGRGFRAAVEVSPRGKALRLRAVARHRVLSRARLAGSGRLTRCHGRPVRLLR
jgi:Right handed beta helix region